MSDYSPYEYPRDTRLTKIPAPIAGIFDAPYACLRLNMSWVGILDGQISRLYHTDAWLGTAQEKKQAANDAMRLFASLSEQCEMLQSVRQNPADLCQLQYTNDGLNWITFAQLNECEHNHDGMYIAHSPQTETYNTILPPNGTIYPLIVYPALGSVLDVIQAYDASHAKSWAINSNGRMVFWKAGTATETLPVGAMGAIYSSTNIGATGNGSLTYQPRLAMGHAWLAGTSSVVLAMVLNNAGKLGIGNMLHNSILAYLHVSPKLGNEIASILKAHSAQTANLHENHTASNVFLSGIDNIGRYIMATDAGKPTDTIVKAGTVSIDAANQNVWIKGANSGTDDWFKIEPIPVDDCCIDTVEIEMIEATEPPNGSVNGNTLTLNIPQTAIPAAADYWFKGREDRPIEGSSKQFDLIVLSTGFTALPCEISEYDVIVVNHLDGWWTDGNFDVNSTSSRHMGYNANGGKFTEPTVFVTDANDPNQSEPHMCPLFEYQRSDGSYTTVRLSDFTSFSIGDLNSVNPYARIFANKGAFDSCSGGIRLGIELVAAPIPLIECTLYAGFVANTAGFIVKDSSEEPYYTVNGVPNEDVQGGIWVLGEGFESEYIPVDGFPGQEFAIITTRGMFSAPLVGNHRFTFTWELSGLTGEDINVRGQQASKSTGGGWVLGNFSHNVYYGNGTHETTWDVSNPDGIGLMLHTLPQHGSGLKLTIKSFECEEL